jgi:hypothetical protein
MVWLAINEHLKPLIDISNQLIGGRKFLDQSRHYAGGFCSLHVGKEKKVAHQWRCLPRPETAALSLAGGLHGGSVSLSVLAFILSKISPLF